MDQKAYGKIKYMSNSLPSLYSGEYIASLEQEIQEPSKKTMPKIEKKFFVETPQFTMSPNKIYSTLPDDGSIGNYENTLPHIMFQDKTFPWRRQFKENEEEKPWIALICFSDKELPEMKKMTIGELIKSSDKDVFCPHYQLDQKTGEKDTDSVVVIDVSVKMMEDIFPRVEELALLSHVKITDMYDKNDELIQRDGYFSTVMANRFPPSSDAGIWNTSVLLSVEGCEEILPSVKNNMIHTKYKYARFIVLHSFKFASQSLNYPGFRIVMEQLSSQSLYLQLANPEEETSDAGKLLKKGYVPLTHITRSGEKTVSVYRGPLAPYEVEDKKLSECQTADGEIHYDPLVGIFDMSYSAAWQLGRLMALKNKSIAHLIFEWRRTFTKSLFMNAMKKSMKNRIAAFFQEKELQEVSQHDTFHADTAFFSFFAHNIGPALGRGEITPIADDTGLERREEGN